MNENKALLYQYSQAAEVIKTAILQSQHQTIVGINRAQLALYFGIGKYLSNKTRNASWGTNALQSISTTLRKYLPGLRGFSANNLKNMRKFYENWSMLDSSSTLHASNSTIAIVDMEDLINESAINNTLHIHNINEFPIEDFFRVPFTHHIRIIEGVKELKAHENPSIGIVLCKSANKEYVEFIIQDYNKPMGVATYTTSADMPENLRNALPDIEELKKLL